MSRSSAKKRDGRLSRKRIPQRGDLRGMSAREYYAHEEMTGGVLSKLKPLIETGLWKKLDRAKPITGEQAKAVRKALGRMAVASKHWPFSWPVVRMRPKGVGAKRPAAEFQHVKVVGMPKVSTPDGVVYVPTNRRIDACGRSGIVGFSSHAIEQWLARTGHAARHVAMRMGLPELAMRMLESTVNDGAIEAGSHGPCLTATHDGEVLGYFPLTPATLGGRRAWVCKTYLRPGMRGVPGELECDCELCLNGDPDDADRNHAESQGGIPGCRSCSCRSR